MARKEKPYAKCIHMFRWKKAWLPRCGIGSWNASDPSPGIDDKRWTAMALFGDVSRFLGSIAAPILTVLPCIYFARNKPPTFVSGSGESKLHNSGIATIAIRERQLQVCDYNDHFIVLACMSIAILFSGVEDEMLGVVPVSIELAFGFSGRRLFPVEDLLSDPLFPRRCTDRLLCVLRDFPRFLDRDGWIGSLGCHGSRLLRFDPFCLHLRLFLLWSRDGGILSNTSTDVFRCGVGFVPLCQESGPSAWMKIHVEWLGRNKAICRALRCAPDRHLSGWNFLSIEHLLWIDTCLALFWRHDPPLFPSRYPPWCMALLPCIHTSHPRCSSFCLRFGSVGALVAILSFHRL